MLKSSNTEVVIFSGFNQRAVVAFIRTLEQKNIAYSIIAKSDEDSIFLSQYASKVVSVRASVKLDLDDIKNQLGKVAAKTGKQNFFLVPSAEAFNRFLLTNRTTLEALHCIIPLVDEPLYASVSDKKSFGSLCNNHGITIPAEFQFNASLPLPLPLVAKPVSYFGANGSISTPVLVADEAEWKNFLAAKNPSDFYYQQFIGGKSFYLLYYFSKNGQVTKMSQENLLQQHEGKSIIAAKSSTLEHHPISGLYEKMLLSIGFFGLIMIELKEYQEKFYMIEANPRLWGPSQLFVDAGTNFFEHLLYDYQLVERVEQNNNTKNHYYFWMGGLMDTIQQNKKPAFHNYNASTLTQQLPELINCEVWRRPDTEKIFNSELLIQ